MKNYFLLLSSLLNFYITKMQCNKNDFLLPDRLRIHETKQMLLQQLTEAMRSMTQLESQLKVLSASTLSMSSSSSLGSLSSSHASSKGNGICILISRKKHSNMLYILNSRFFFHSNYRIVIISVFH